MEIQARFTHNKINHSEDNDIHMVVSLKAPTIDWVEKRQHVCILPVIDTSGSMAGPKIAYAKQSVEKLIEHLRPGDVCGLIGFNYQAHVLVAPKAVTREFKEQLKAAVSRLQPGGGTNFSEGLLQAVELIKNMDLSSKFIQRVIMFTDGQPTTGVTDKPTILKQLAGAKENVTISAFGYGESGGGEYEGCDQDFLSELSKEGRGNYAYVKDPDDALAAFGKELGGLLSTYATDLRIEIEPQNAHRVTSVVSDVKSEMDTLGKVEVEIPDILAEETRNIVLSTKLGKQGSAFPRETTVFDLKVDWVTRDEAGVRAVKSETLKAKVQFVKADDVQEAPTKEVDEIVALAKMIRAQLEAEKVVATTSDYKAAAMIMDNAAHNAHGGGYAHIAEMGHRLSASVGSKSAFMGSAGLRRSVSYGVTRSVGIAAMDADARVMLDSAGVSMNATSSQQSVMDSFTSSGTGGTGWDGTVATTGSIPATPVLPLANSKKQKK